MVWLRALVSVVWLLCFKLGVLIFVWLQAQRFGFGALAFVWPLPNGVIRLVETYET